MNTTKELSIEKRQSLLEGGLLMFWAIGTMVLPAFAIREFVIPALALAILSLSSAATFYIVSQHRMRRDSHDRT